MSHIPSHKALPRALPFLSVNLLPPQNHETGSGQSWLGVSKCPNTQTLQSDKDLTTPLSSLQPQGAGPGWPLPPRKALAVSSAAPTCQVQHHSGG